MEAKDRLAAAPQLTKAPGGRAVKEAGVGVIPVSAFYDQVEVTSVVRLCFAAAA